MIYRVDQEKLAATLIQPPFILIFIPKDYIVDNIMYVMIHSYKLNETLELFMDSLLQQKHIRKQTQSTNLWFEKEHLFVCANFEVSSFFHYVTVIILRSFLRLFSFVLYYIYGQTLICTWGRYYVCDQLLDFWYLQVLTFRETIFRGLSAENILNCSKSSQKT